MLLGSKSVFDPTRLPLIAILAALTSYLAWAYRAAFAPMLRARVEPAAADLAPPQFVAPRTATP